MIKSVLEVLKAFSVRMQRDHIGAYAATCAYFLMISFVPFVMLFLFFVHRVNADPTMLTEGIISIVPNGLKSFVSSILDEADTRSYAFVPVSFVVLIWSASKMFHAVTLGLNVISKVPETRGWLYIRVRSMLYVLLFFLFVIAALILNIFGKNIANVLLGVFPGMAEFLAFIYRFRAMIGYFGMMLLFLFMYKFLPNCHYTFRSQFPGALVVSTVWLFFSYLMSVYFAHNQNFAETYGSMTSMILAMIWLYICCFFLMFGALLNRVIYEDPEDNVIVNTVDVVRGASERQQKKIEEELEKHSFTPEERKRGNESRERSLADRVRGNIDARQARCRREAEEPSDLLPDDIRIPWYDDMVDEWDREEEELVRGTKSSDKKK